MQCACYTQRPEEGICCVEGKKNTNVHTGLCNDNRMIQLTYDATAGLLANVTPSFAKFHNVLFLKRDFWYYGEVSCPHDDS
jgi:hypothetical protein